MKNDYAYQNLFFRRFAVVENSISHDLEVKWRAHILITQYSSPGLVDSNSLDSSLVFDWVPTNDATNGEPLRLLSIATGANL